MRRRFKSHCLKADNHNYKIVHMRAIHEPISVSGIKPSLFLPSALHGGDTFHGGDWLLNAPAALSLGNEPPLPLEQEAG
jgi:hypothetical protein